MKVLKRLLIFLIVLCIFALSALFVNEKINEKVFLKEYTFSHSEIPKSFDGYKIMIISDLHEAPFKKQICDRIEASQPDLIAFTGDMVQLPGNSPKVAMEIAENFKDRIPMYVISGNHERQCGSYNDVMGMLWGAGAVPLENDSVELKSGDESILLIGVKDPESDNVSEEKIEKMKEAIKEELPDGPCFSVLLSHRADLFPDLKGTGPDLILSGHIHGGIVRLPYVGGVFGQSEKFPKYDYGLFTEDNCSMIISGGCDKNPEKKRYFNPPEVVLVTLKGENYE